MKLDEQRISQALLDLGCKKNIKVHVFPSIDSTNEFLKTVPQQHTLEICCAETQTKGRGRFQRPWFSPPQQNIYCSLLYFCHHSSTNLSSLSLVISLALMQTLEPFNLDKTIGIKWPNDLLWQGKKLAGILIESIPEQQNSMRLVIGVGLNVNSDPHDSQWQQAQDKPWCSLLEITGRPLDRNRLIAEIVMQIQTDMAIFFHQGLKPFLPLWEKWDILKGQLIEILHNQKKIRGMAQGINLQGELRIMDSEQQIKYCSSGETSLILPTPLGWKES